MELSNNNVLVIVGSVLGVYLFVFGFVRRLSEIWYLVKLGRKAHSSLPPGDLGWPLIGSTISFYKAFTAGGHPDSFIHSLLSRYGRVGMYKSHLYGKPTIIVTDAEICRRMYLDDERFKPSYPASVRILEGDGSFTRIDHKSAYRIMAAPMNGYEVLSQYVGFIEQTMTQGLEEWSSMKKPIELLGEIESLFIKVVSCIFLGTEINVTSRIADVQTLYKELSPAILSIFPYDLPGSTFRRALKAREEIKNIFECVIEEKRRALENKEREVRCQVDKLIMAADDDGTKSYDKNAIIDLLLGLIHSGRSTPAHAAVWALLLISEKPHVFQKAKEEQESIIKQRPPTQKGLTWAEIKQMKYLMKFINELLRTNTIAVASFRKAETGVNINGYTIPKGWVVALWARAVHMDPQIYSNPEEFDPSRWDNYTAKAGEFIPFGIGSRFCPGSELAKLQITILLHHFILNYKMERVNPKCKITYIPSPRPVDNCLCKIIRLPE